jgi:glycosyltransferase involved in cell wall biosynthesis
MALSSSSEPKRSLAIVCTHPIQYQVPWFRALAARPELELKVYFAMLPDPAQQGSGFGIPFQWDIPMLEGYSWEVLQNARRRPELGSFRGSSSPGIGSILERTRPDAVLVTGWHALPLLQALWASRRLKIPTIVRGDSNNLKPRPPWTRLLHRTLLSQIDAFMTVGKANRSFYIENGVAECRIFSAPHFVDNARFRAGVEVERPRRAELRARWGIPMDAVCFSYVGKLQKKKRILDLVAAMARLQDSGLRTHLLVVGAGELMPAARALAGQNRVPVTFGGFLNQTELPAAYAVTDCLVLHSDYGETWGLVVNEAMACGIPAVVSDRVGCGPDLVEHGVTGLVYPFGDVEALSGALRSLAIRPVQLADMGARARDRVAGYSVERAVAGTLEAVRYVATNRPG